MKLSIAKKENESKEMSIQDKVNKIMGNNADTETKGNDKMKLNINKGNESKGNKSKSILELKKSKGINEKNLELSIDKFSKVNDIMIKIENLDNTFTEFLSNQNQSIAVINGFTNKIDTLETITTNIIKNQKSILNAVNSIAAKFQNVGNFYNADTETKGNESKESSQKVIIRKKENESKESFDNIDSIFNEFQKNFGNNNFMGNKELNPESKVIFQNLIESIEIDSIDTITESIAKFRSNLTKESGKYMTARKSNKNFDSAIIKTIESINGNAFNISESKESSTVINKDYFVSLFNLDIETIEALIKESIDYFQEHKAIDNSLIIALTDYIKSENKNVSDNSLGQFINFIKAYIEVTG